MSTDNAGDVCVGDPVEWFGVGLCGPNRHVGTVVAALPRGWVSVETITGSTVRVHASALTGL